MYNIMYTNSITDANVLITPILLYAITYMFKYYYIISYTVWYIILILFSITQYYSVILSIT